MLANVATLEALHRPLTDAERARAELLLEKASNKVLFLSRADWDEDTVPAIVADIVLEVAWRAFVNPDGMLRERIGVGYDYQRADGRGGVFLTDEERDTILAAAGRAAGVGSIKLTRPVVFVGDEPFVFTPVADGGDSLLWEAYPGGDDE